MKKIISTISVVAIIAVISLALPTQTYAAWWSPLSWFSKNQQAATSSNTASEPQTVNQNVAAKEKQDTVAPIANPQSSDTKKIKDLEIEVATLKTSLDNLYKAHSGLVNDHNALLAYVKATVSSGKSVSAASNSSNLETRVTALERKLETACQSIFNVLSGCPSMLFGGGSLEDRIEKLERAR